MPKIWGRDGGGTTLAAPKLRAPRLHSRAITRVGAAATKRFTAHTWHICRPDGRARQDQDAYPPSRDGCDRLIFSDARETAIGEPRERTKRTNQENKQRNEPANAPRKISHASSKRQAQRDHDDRRKTKPRRFSPGILPGDDTAATNATSCAAA